MVNTEWPKTGALLLVGAFFAAAPDKNIEETAYEYAKKVLLEDGQHNGPLFDAKTHPDFYTVMPEKNAQWIKIDQIRALIEWSFSKPQIALKKVAIISPAHALNLQAANALLKTLEDPVSEVLFMLVTDKPSFIPATVRSRCFWIRLGHRMQVNLASSLFETLEKGLLALENQAMDPVMVGDQWLKLNPKEVLDTLYLVMCEAINHPLQRRENQISQSSKKISRNRSWWQFLDKIAQAKQVLEENAKPNWQLLLESLLIEYYSLVQSAPVLKGSLS